MAKTLAGVTNGLVVGTPPLAVLLSFTPWARSDSPAMISLSSDESMESEDCIRAMRPGNG